MLQVVKQVIGLASVVIVTALIITFRLDVVLANVSMLYLLVVFLVGLYVGRSAAVISSLLSFAAFDWFFVEPRHTLSVNSASEWLTLCMFLLVSTITGQLTSQVRAAAAEAKQRQTETETLAKASWAISSQLTTEEALTEVLKQLKRVADIEAAAVITYGPEAKVTLRASITGSGAQGDALLLAEIDRQLLAARENDAQMESRSELMWTPVAHGGTQAGAVYIRLSAASTESAEQKHLIETLVNHAVVILQREELMKEQSRTQALEEADKLKTALLSMVSHDFRSPLTGIKAAVSALLQESPDDGMLIDGSFKNEESASTIKQAKEKSETRQLLEGIEQEADRINRMVGNILNLSRLEADAWKPMLEAASLAEIIGSSLGSFSRENNQRITVTLPDDLAEIMVDTVQIEQVFKNLTENALKYSPAGSLIQFEVKQQPEHLSIKIMDRGRGIAPEDTKKIFDRFYRNAALEETAIPGVGIGLAICKSLIEAHQGTLTASPREGGGTTFEVQLPRTTLNKQANS